MSFPISVCYNKRLKAIITAENEAQILNFIEKSLLNDKADNIVVEERYIKYRGSTSAWRGSLFGIVDNGVFSLIFKDGNWWLTYQINMCKLFIGTAVLSSVMGFFALITGGPRWIGIAAFLWLCGANWITNVIKHGSVATHISAALDELICSKAKVPEDDKMTGELKSWF